MWCHVRYLKDNLVVNVHTSFFKDIVEKKITANDLIVRATYKVFWSPNPDESPQDVLMANNDILNVDDFLEEEKKRRKKSRSGPLKGYYDALLLDVRSNEDSFEDVSSSRTTSSKRVCIPSIKVAEALTSKLSEPPKKKKSTKLNVEKNRKTATESASKNNILDLLKKCGTAPKHPQDNSSEKSDSDDDVHCSVKSSNSDVESTDGVEESSDTSDDLDKKKHNDQKSDANSEEYWKQKYFEMVNKSQVEKKKKKVKKEKPAKKQELPSQATRIGHSTLKPHTETPARTAQLSSVTDTPASSSNKEAVFSSSQSKEDRKHMEADRAIQGKSFYDIGTKAAEKIRVHAESEVKLNEEGDGSDEDVGASNSVGVKVLKKLKVKPGKGGDSLFVMNKAATLWEPKVLAIRSATGLPQSCRVKAKEKGYPKMTPEKVQEISSSFKRRLQEEGADKDERRERFGRLNYYLGQKVSVVRRSLKASGVSVPSPDDVWKTRETPSGDLGAYQDAGAEPPK